MIKFAPWGWVGNAQEAVIELEKRRLVFIRFIPWSPRWCCQKFTGAVEPLNANMQSSFSHIVIFAAVNGVQKSFYWKNMAIGTFWYLNKELMECWATYFWLRLMNITYRHKYISRRTWEKPYHFQKEECNLFYLLYQQNLHILSCTWHHMKTRD